MVVGILTGGEWLQGKPRIGEVIEPALNVPIAFRARLTLGRSRRPSAQDSRGQHVKLRGFVDRLDRIPAKLLVTPRNKIFQVLLHDCKFIGTRALPGNQVRTERIPRPLLDRIPEAGITLRQVFQPFIYRAFLLTKWLKAPVSDRVSLGVVGGWIEDQMEPALGFFKTLRPAELSRNQQRNVEKGFPVINTHGRLFEVDLHLSHGIRIIGVKMRTWITNEVDSCTHIEGYGHDCSWQSNRLNHIARCDGRFEFDRPGGRKGNEPIPGIADTSPKQ